MALYPDIFEAVNAAIPATAIAPEALFFGGEHINAEAEPPRIVWEPTTDGFSPSQPRGSSRSDLRALYTCESGVDIHCWGKDAPGALALRDAVLQALRATLGPNLLPLGGRWVAAQLVQAGRVYVLSIKLNIPITEAAPTENAGVATVTAETHDPGQFVTA